MVESARHIPAIDSLERFSLKERVGAGGFGEVYRAWDTKRNEVVALKVLRDHDARAHLQLAGEITRVRHLAHKNLVRVYELLYVRRRPILVLEYLGGARPFHAWVRGEAVRDPKSLELNTFSAATMEATQINVERTESLVQGIDPMHHSRWDALVSMSAQLASGLQTLHGHGLVHRDIKPSNVVISEGRAVLLDYGLTTPDGRALIDLTGTAGYIAPELVAGSSASLASDVYSFGILALRTIIGRMLSRAERSEPDTVRKLVDAPARYSDVLDILIRCIAQAPAERPSTSELNAAFRAILPNSDLRSLLLENVDRAQLQKLSGVVGSLAERESVLVHGPRGSGKGQVASEASRQWANSGSDREVVRVSGDVPLLGQIGEQIILAGCEELGKCSSISQIDRRVLRLSQLIVPYFPLLESTLEQLGVPRVFISPESYGDGLARQDRMHQSTRVMALWLRAIYADREWMLLAENMPGDEPLLHTLVEWLFAPADSQPCSRLLVTTDLWQPLHGRMPNLRALACPPLPDCVLENVVAPFIPEIPNASNLLVPALRSVANGYAGATQSILQSLGSDPEKTLRRVAKAESGAGAANELVRLVTDDIDEASKALLWMICAAGEPIPMEVIQQAIGAEGQELTAQLHQKMLVRRDWREGTTMLVPYTPGLAIAFRAIAGEDVKERARTLLRAMTTGDIWSSHLKARLLLDLEPIHRVRPLFSDLMRDALVAKQRARAVAIASSFPDIMRPTSRQSELIARILIDAGRPLDASQHYGQEFAILGPRSASPDSKDKNDLYNPSRLWFARTQTPRFASAGDARGYLKRLVRSLRRNLPRRNAEASYGSLFRHKSTFELTEARNMFGLGSFHECIGLCNEQSLVIDTPIARLPLARVQGNYLAARAHLFLGHALKPSEWRPTAGYSSSDANDAYHTALAWMTCGWLQDVQRGLVSTIRDRLKSLPDALGEDFNHPVTRELIAEIRIALRSIDPSSSRHADMALQEQRMSSWAGHVVEFIDAYLVGIGHIWTDTDVDSLRTLLVKGYRQSMHSGVHFAASTLAWAFGATPELREQSEEQLIQAGWDHPHTAVAMLLGITPDDISELIARIGGIPELAPPPGFGGESTLQIDLDYDPTEF